MGTIPATAEHEGVLENYYIIMTGMCAAPRETLETFYQNQMINGRLLSRRPFVSLSKRSGVYVGLNQS